jgi:hypothetical protein
MSEENIKPKIPTIKIDISRSAEIEGLQKENAELKLTLEQIAKKEFEAKCRKYGCNPATTDIETLKQIEAENKKAPIGGTTAPLNQAQLGEKEEGNICSSDLDPEFWEFTSHSAMFKALQDTANDPQNPQQKQAQQILGKLIKKQHKQGGVYELQGNLTNITKKGAKQPYFDKIKEEE